MDVLAREKKSVDSFLSAIVLNVIIADFCSLPYRTPQANVYHALTSSKAHLALKIYKTSILVFKDRDRYVTGEHRFRRGYSKNPRKMVKLWAEKEMRNLRRLNAAGIRSPEPVEVRENVLIMSFIGNSEGW